MLFGILRQYKKLTGFGILRQYKKLTGKMNPCILYKWYINTINLICNIGRVFIQLFIRSTTIKQTLLIFTNCNCIIDFSYVNITMTFDCPIKWHLCWYQAYRFTQSHYGNYWMNDIFCLEALYGLHKYSKRSYILFNVL